MAKKKEPELSYMQLPLPEGTKYYKQTKLSWSGLNKRQTLDTGVLSAENNISTAEAPYLTPSKARKPYYTSKPGCEPISLFAFDGSLIYIYNDTAQQMIKLDYLKPTANSYKTYTGLICDYSKETDNDKYGDTPRSMVQFNVYDTPTDPVDGQFVKQLLLFPDKKSMPLDIEEKDLKYDADSDGYDFILDSITDCPNMNHVTVHLSRLFGVDDSRIYASGYNNYANWNLDTADEYNESNAWCSPSQANTKAGGDFTGITTFQNHVVCFKRDFMHEIYNTKNPFRIQDIYAEGAVDNRTIQDVDGKLVFVSDDNVKVYTGSNPRIISYNLNIDKYANPVAGTDGRNYYLYCKENGNHSLYVYDTYVEEWSQQYIENSVLNFAHNKNGMYALLDDGIIYRLDTDEYADEWSFETDLITNQTMNIKHIKKIQMFADIGEGAWVNVYLLRDDEKFDPIEQLPIYSSGYYDNVLEKWNPLREGRTPIRFKPRNTANYGVKLHVEGSGYVRLYELELFTQAGGELYV